MNKSIINLLLMLLLILAINSSTYLEENLKQSLHISFMVNKSSI